MGADPSDGVRCGERAIETRVFRTRGIVLIEDSVGAERDIKAGVLLENGPEEKSVSSLETAMRRLLSSLAPDRRNRFMKSDESKPSRNNVGAD